VPLSGEGALDLKIDGKIDARLANSALSPTGRSIAGAIVVAAQLRGTVAKPEAEGSIRIANGEFRDEQSGFKLSGISGVIIANGDMIRIERLEGATPDGGTISASGEARLDPAAGFPGTIRVTGKHAQLVATSIVSATADLALTVSGKLAQKPNVDGRITIDSMDVTVPDRFSSVSAPIPGTKHVNPTPTAEARLKQIAKANPSQGPRQPVRRDAERHDLGPQPQLHPRTRHLRRSRG
jgi:translocation and assembly module TamB